MADDEDTGECGPGPDMTIRNTYQTTFLPEYVSKRKGKPRNKCPKEGDEEEIEEPPEDPNRDKNVTIKLTENNISDYSDITRLGWKKRVDHSVQQLDIAKAKSNREKDFFRDPNRLLEVTLSTIILAASGEVIPKEHMICTFYYLKSIKDAHGDHPPNISNFLHYLNHVKKEQDIEFKQTFRFEPDMPLVTAKLDNPMKLSKTPVEIVDEEIEEFAEPTDEDRKAKCKNRSKS